VQNTTYEAVKISTTDLGSLKNSISTSTASVLTGINPAEEKGKFYKDIETKTSEAIYPVIEKTKLNLRYNYFFDLVMFTSLSILSLLFAFLLKAEDKKKGYGLELPNIKR
jgi:cytochrome oxidase assembly protein ShyY1